MIKLGPFGGMLPLAGERFLPDNASTSATNVKLQSGEIHPLHSPGDAITVSKEMPPLAIYRARNGITNAAWMTWPFDVDVVRAPFDVSVESRFYWTGDGEPRYGRFSDVTSGGGNDYPHTFFALGVPTPTTAPSVSVTGGTGSNVTRFYRYSFYSALGEESGLSPISEEVTGKVDGTWSVGATTPMQAFPISSGTYTGVFASGETVCTSPDAHWLRDGDEVVINGVTLDVSGVDGFDFTVQGDYSAHTTWARKAPWNTVGMTRQLYRTTGGLTGSWQLVADGITATSYTDTLTDAQILGDEAITEGWEPPPSGLIALALHPSGSLIGILNNILCMSEPHQPHAWPTKYRLSSGYTGVALACFGTSIVMATEGSPFVASGTGPGSMSGENIAGLPCLSKRSILSIGDSVLYSSKHGMAQIGASGFGIFTKDAFTPENWSALNPDTMISALADGRIYISYTNDSGTRQVIVFDSGILVGVSVSADELYTDEAKGDLYIGTAEGIQLFDDQTKTVLTGSWKSKEFVTPAPVNFGAAKIDFDVAIDPAQQAAVDAARTAAIAANTAAIASGNVNGSINAYGVNANGLHSDSLVDVPDAPAANIVTFNMYVDNVLKFSRVVSSKKAFRLPAGFKKDAFKFEVVSQCVIKEIRVAETMDQLRQA